MAARTLWRTHTKLLVVGTALCGGSGAAFIASSEDPSTTLKVCTSIPIRFFCDTVTAASIAFAKYGTRHVLVLANFSPSLRTTDLEKLFKDYKDSGFIIRWVNDTTALAVFKTPSAALEACNHVQCSFTIRVLDDHDSLLGSISGKDALLVSMKNKSYKSSSSSRPVQSGSPYVVEMSAKSHLEPQADLPQEWTY